MSQSVQGGAKQSTVQDLKVYCPGLHTRGVGGFGISTSESAQIDKTAVHMRKANRRKWL